jgi:hypothetical protein
VLQVFLTFPVTVLIVRLFKQLDFHRSAKICFEIRVATDKAKLLHGISQDHPVDLRRSIHEVQGLLRIIERSNRSNSKRREDEIVVATRLSF